MVPKFQIRQADNGQFYNVLIGRNGEVLSRCEEMTQKHNVKNNIDAQIDALSYEFEIEDIDGKLLTL